MKKVGAVRGKVKFIVASLLILALSLILFFSSFQLSWHWEKYESLFSQGEGLSYRSFVFETILPTSNPYPLQLNNSFAYCRGTYDAHAEQLTAGVFQAAKAFTQGLGAVKMEGKWGYIRLLEKNDPGFELAIPLIYEAAEPFSEDLAAVKSEGKYGYIDRNGKIVIQPQFEEAHYFSQGLAAVKDAEGWYFIDSLGSRVIAGPFEAAESFSATEIDTKSALAPVKLQGKWGYIDLSGTVVIKAIYQDAWAFERSGKAAVKINDKWQFIDVNGNRLWL